MEENYRGLSAENNQQNKKAMKENGEKRNGCRYYPS